MNKIIAGSWHARSRIAILTRGANPVRDCNDRTYRQVSMASACRLARVVRKRVAAGWRVAPLVSGWFFVAPYDPITGEYNVS